MTTNDPFDKGLPNAIEMERSVLGAALLDNSVVDEMIELLPVPSFFLDSSRRIATRMYKLRAELQPIDLITLSDALRQAGEFEQIGGATYISSLIDGVPRTDTIEPYAKIIRQRYRAQLLIRAAQKMTTDAFEDPDSEELLSKAESYLSYIAAGDLDRAEVKPLSTFADEYVSTAERARDRGDRITGIPTGYLGFDLRTLGLQRQELTILAARISIGKTTLSWNMAQNIAGQPENYRALYWSGEVPGERIAGKAIAKEAQVDSFKMRSGYYDENKVVEALRTFDRWGDRITLCDKPYITVSEFRSICRRWKTQKGLDVIFADYLLLFAPPPGITDRREAVSQNCLMLKNLARELNVSLVLLHQLSRAGDSRSAADEEPRLSDLAESGDVERHADVVLFLWRPRRPKAGHEGITQCVIAKQRNGPVGKFGLAYIKAQDRFENLADEQGLFNKD